MRVLLAGGTGFLGTRLGAALMDAGCQLTLLARSSASARKRFPNAAAYEWNGMVGLPPAEAFDGVDAVVNLIGEPISSRWTAERKRRFRDSRVLPTRALVERMTGLSQRPRVFLSIAGAGYYGDRGDEVLTEKSTGGSGFLAHVAQEWESAALVAGDAGIRVVVPRMGVVLARDAGILQRLLGPFRWGLGAQFGAGEQYFPWIHVADAVGLMMHLLGFASGQAAPSGDPRVLPSGPVNGVAPEPVTNREFTNALARSLGRQARLRVPAFALKVAFGELADEVLLGSQRISPVVALASGYQFRYPLLREALAELFQSKATDGNRGAGAAPGAEPDRNAEPELIPVVSEREAPPR
jgi:uncharacterized protein (TIGR01777 family)